MEETRNKPLPTPDMETKFTRFGTGQSHHHLQNLFDEGIARNLRRDSAQLPGRNRDSHDRILRLKPDWHLPKTLADASSSSR
jgi:hypothetical protein